MIEFWLVLVIIVAVLGYYQVRDNRCTIRYDDQDVPYKLEPQKNVRVKKVNKRNNNNKKKSVKRKASITKLKKNTKRTRRTTSVEKNKKR